MTKRTAIKSSRRAQVLSGALATMAAASLVAYTSPALAQPAPQPPMTSTLTDDAPFVFQEGVAIAGVGQGGRRAFATDAVQAQIVQGNWQPPKAGDTVRLPNGTERTWESLKADDKGTFSGRALSGYLYASVTSPDDRPALLDARGPAAVYVNGELRMGNPYGYEYGRLPVKLHRGVNHFLFVGGRGQLTARLLPVKTDATTLLNADDPTLPDLLVGETGPLWAAVIVVNASDTPLTGLRMQARVSADATQPGREQETALPTIAPWSTRKVGFHLAAPPNLTPGKAQLALRILSDRKSTAVASADVPLRVMRPTEIYKRTFVSQIDGSVQYYGVNPAQKPAADNALVLSLHGASVEALGQAQAYGTKDWATLIAPTNRRPYGFDWEDWGRLDALEVLGIAEKSYPHDPTRVVLTGHSMGGHGSWSIGSLFPDRFAAIGPSAGWISFSTYAGGPANAAPAPTGPAALVARGNSLSDTLARGTNLLQDPVYIVHGDADDNVPIEQARQMKAYLTEHHHPNLQIHEEKGAGHWWDASPAPGADCVDWAPMFDLFQKVRITTPSTVDFATPDPAVSDSCYYVRIEQQNQIQQVSDVHVTYDAAKAALSGTTANIKRLAVTPSRLPGKGALRQITLDGQTLSVPTSKADKISLASVGGRWQIAKPLSPSEKNPDRSGGFKQAFRNRFVLLYGTHGTPEENAWAFARARYDAEAFWYRGNGAPDVLPDTTYNDRANGKFAGRNVIVYGNADTNTAWSDLFKGSPVQVYRNRILTGDNARTGDNLACVFLRPRAGSDTALVGAITGTGLPGLRLTDRLPIFVSGVAFPDWVIADTGVLSDATQGIVGAGYFGNDWKLDAAQSAWRP